MDNFNLITETATNRNIGGNPFNVSVGNKKKKAPKLSLSSLNDQALDDMLKSLREKLGTEVNAQRQSVLQSRIDAVEKEVIGRNKSSVEGVPTTLLPENNRTVGQNVGAGAVMFGIIGVVTAYSLGTPEKNVLYGALGVIAGGALGFWLTNKSQKGESKLKPKK